MWVKVLMASLIALFGLMYWQAPDGQTRAGAVTNEPASEWRKLREPASLSRDDAGHFILSLRLLTDSPIGFYRVLVK